MEDKKEIRCIVRQRIKEMTSEAREEASTSIFQKIENSTPFNEAKCIALFASMNDEVSTKSALLKWHGKGKHIVVPKVEGDIMRFYDYKPEEMTTGAFGIEEPTSNIEAQPEDIDLIIGPARAFTREGIRLGRGGGFYDKYMSQPSFHAYKVGIAYECQIFESLPHAPHDIAVDTVISEK